MRKFLLRQKVILVSLPRGLGPEKEHGIKRGDIGEITGYRPDGGYMVEINGPIGICRWIFKANHLAEIKPD